MISEFIAHVNGAVTPAVEYAWTSNPVDEFDEDSGELPAIYVYPGDYSVDESGVDNFVRQRVRQTVVCMLVCRIAEYETLREELRSAVLGWTFEDHDAFELAGGEFLELSGGVIFVREIFRTYYLISEGN